MLVLIGTAAASFFLCLLAIFALRPIAFAVDLIDRPGGRKTHHGNIPVVGGLAMFIGIVLGVGLLPLPDARRAAFLAACAILVTVGLVDDRFDLSPWTRLPGQVSAAIVLIVGSGALVTTLGNPFASGAITLSGIFAYCFTVTITVAAVNAFNMLDGIDGLAGATALIALLAITWLSWTGNLGGAAAISLVVAGAVCAFLIFNLPLGFNRRVRCFMGDAGSTLLGLAVAWLCIEISQGPVRTASPVVTLWIVALPLFELFWTTIRRVIRGVSPFTADRNHFHHLLLRAGFGVRGAFGIFVVLTALLAGIGILTQRLNLPDHYSFLLLLFAGVGTVFFMYRAEVLWRFVPTSLRAEPGASRSRPQVGFKAKA